MMSKIFYIGFEEEVISMIAADIIDIWSLYKKIDTEEIEIKDMKHRALPFLGFDCYLSHIIHL